MKSITAAAIALAIVSASPVFAQGHSHGKSEEHHGRVTVQSSTQMNGRQRAGDGHVYSNGRVVQSTSSSGSPAFCRSGAGHPVFGRAWCVQKGFGLGNSSWNRVTWSGVVLQPRRATIGDVLGGVILGRLANYAQTLGYRSPLVGTWLTNTPDRRVYIVRSGRSQVAELVDVNNDGRADYILLRH